MKCIDLNSEEALKLETVAQDIVTHFLGQSSGSKRKQYEGGDRILDRLL
ncbi:hypothetical protein H6G20_14375 [Desertifilum sp. FACHB-1129]|uniref:Uncharacterized protein n=1 Tax=Desertifilum tharense IPPAS B-1220 TaxID=1781255 RepID=A0ACD5GYU7_9CYAN|nr:MULTISPECIES: hypothetical protein [Desertifilum]MBD2312855.1 hypothetical protein [Desertifilum sp. FACHB-1129]MBD2324219.1 hypothetical protein [Desertifilum sp. FACHB-866]MBD2334233.1 hypothetical protein [Desertifilum sp. FACHB-868]MDA0212275.1 hypothetical protein [Cyanobacteria bacterium FC1]